MATISAANAQALADSVAAHVSALAALLGSPAAITTGQATTLGRVAALTDASQEFFLLDGFEAFVASEQALIGSWQSYNSILDAAFTACAALHNATGGLAAFLIANSLVVAPPYVDAHNRAVARGQNAPSVALGPQHSFGPVVASLGQVNVTGASAGTFVDGATEGASPAGAGAAYGNAPLSIFNAGGSNTGASATVVQVTYSQYNASGVLVTGLTASATMPAASVPNAAVSLAVSGVDVTNITVTSNGNSGDHIGVRSGAVRVPAY